VAFAKRSKADACLESLDGNRERLEGLARMSSNVALRSTRARLRELGVLAFVMLGLWSKATLAAVPCDPASNLGVARTIEIDATNGPLFGGITKFAREESFLQPREVVLTFDDGPMPWITKSILDTLDRACTKATFFSVGRMAIAYPDSVRDVLARGHTLGTHTWSHPLNMKRMKADASTNEIERGFAAVAAAAGQPIAPFFRFPGLSDSGAMLSHLQQRHVATFTVDVVSNDSFIADANRLVRETIAKVEARKGGIVLFHDIKVSTAKALPNILSELKARGYRVVHVTSKHAFVPDRALAAEYGAKVASVGGKSRRGLMPFFGTTGPTAINSGESQDANDHGSANNGSLVSQVAGSNRAVTLVPDGKSYGDGAAASSKPRQTAEKTVRRTSVAIGDGWSAVVRRADGRRQP
jgi:peptidoglycan-N-acetylglucosamine deacetylase